MDGQTKRVALLHGAGYVGGELIGLLSRHPNVTLETVTSRAFAGEPVWHAHPHLRGQSDLLFADEDMPIGDVDAILIAAEHGKAAEEVLALLAQGFRGVIIDLSADFRFRNPEEYRTWFGFTHPAPDLLDEFVYGMPEIAAPYPSGTKYIANPGCFATGITLALWPLARHLSGVRACVTALTGASGSGTRPKETTHFPTREGNVRAYKVLEHQHLPEIRQALGTHAAVDFVPVSGPWTRGIWGTIHVIAEERPSTQEVDGWYQEAYGESAFVRLWPHALPELRYSVNTPFCDVGWMVKDDVLLVGFGIDNLLKGAASQAVQNLNLLLGLPETAGLLPVQSFAMT